MHEYAVITGDIIGSTTYVRIDKNFIIERAQKVMQLLWTRKNEYGTVQKFVFYRGDSFQGLLSKPGQALRVALMLKCQLKASEYYWEKNLGWGQESEIMHAPKEVPDARIAIGIGKVNNLHSNLSLSQGPAFERSGRLLDKIYKENYTLQIGTGDDDVDWELKVSAQLLEAIQERWTPYQAMYILQKLENPAMIDSEIAKSLKVSQPAVSQRRNASNWDAVKGLLDRFDHLMGTKLQQTK